jgi:hypothetical protein
LCPINPPAPAPTIALPRIAGGKMMPTSAPTAAPVQAPCCVGFSVFVTRTLPSSSLRMTAESKVPIAPIA